MSKPNILSLQSQLDSYSAASNSRKFVPDWTKRWPVYAAAASSALAFATNAQAAIVYSGVKNLTASLPHSWTGRSMRAGKTAIIDGAPFEFQVTQQITGGVFHNGTATVRGFANNILHLPNGYAKPFSSGQVISGAGPAGNYGRLHHRDSSHFGTAAEFQSGKVAFEGIEIGQGANKQFGWIRLDFHNSAGGYPISITAIDWAYNSVANAPIIAGDEGTSAPEPGTTSLALLALGSAGVFAWRKSRKQTAA